VERDSWTTGRASNVRNVVFRALEEEKLKLRKRRSRSSSGDRKVKESRPDFEVNRKVVCLYHPQEAVRRSFEDSRKY
jgi:hypothetical protein